MHRLELDWFMNISYNVSSPNIDNMRQPDRNETALDWKSTGSQWNILASDKNR